MVGGGGRPAMSPLGSPIGAGTRRPSRGRADFRPAAAPAEGKYAGTALARQGIDGDDADGQLMRRPSDRHEEVRPPPMGPGPRRLDEPSRGDAFAAQGKSRSNDRHHHAVHERSNPSIPATAAARWGSSANFG